MNAHMYSLHNRSALSLVLMLATTTVFAQVETSKSADAVSVQRMFVGPMTLGSRTRVELKASTPGPLFGTLRAIDDTSITLETSDGAAMRTPLNEIRSIATFVPPHRNAKKWARLGALVGGAGLALAAVSASKNGDEGIHGLYYGLVFGAVGGGALGGIAGALTLTEGWKKVMMVPIQSAETGAADHVIGRPGQGPPPPSPAAATGDRSTGPSVRSRAEHEWQLVPTFRSGAGLQLNFAW